MKMKPKVTIAIPTIGREYFEFSSKSAIIQDFDDLEIVVCDFGKNSLTRDFVKSFRDKRVRYFKLKDPGRLEGYTVAIKLSRGKYIKPTS